MRNRFCLALLPLCLALLLPRTASARYMVPWVENPAIHALSDSMKMQSAVFILEEKIVELVNAGDDYRYYRTVHHIIHLNDNKAVEGFNTFNIPIGYHHSTEGIRARTILPGGKTIEVSNDKIKEVKDEDGDPEFLVAFEGVEPGAEVELLFTQELQVSSYGTEVYQFGTPIQSAVFRLIVPERMRYDLKGYNGFPDPKDSLGGGRHFYTATTSNISLLASEPYSLYRPSLKRVDYKLSYLDGEDTRKLTWSDYAKQMYKTLSTFTDGEQREAGKLNAAIGIQQSDDDKTKIVAIEDYFKTNISISEGLTDEDAGNFKTIAKKKLATEKGYMRFFVACVANAGVPYEVGLVSGRFSYPVDEDLEIWDRLSIYAIYLPKLKAYLAPTAVTFRYPVLPYQICGAKGLFTKTTTLGSMVSALPDMRVIPHTTLSQNVSSVNALVRFEGASLTPNVTLTHSFIGYGASGVREVFLFASADKQKEMVQTICGIAPKITDIDTYRVENAPFSAYTTGKPLEIVTQVKSPSLLEKAGPKYLFKVGDLIGKQSELYQEEKRSLPIEIEFPHNLPRTLRISIPDGYKIANPEAVRANVLYDQNDKEACGFVSDYKMDGKDMVVTIREYYRNVSYPLSGYEPFRKVINASADFNKVVLVLQKI